MFDYKRQVVWKIPFVASICCIWCDHLLSIGIGMCYSFWLFYIYLLSHLWLIIICIGNLHGLFSTFVGGGECWGCCGIGRCTGLSIILRCSSLFSEMYCVLDVLVCMWLVQWVGQFWMQVGLENSCVAIFSAFASSLVGIGGIF